MQEVAARAAKESRRFALVERLPSTKAGRPEVIEPPMVGAGRCAVVSAGMLVRWFALW